MAVSLAIFLLMFGCLCNTSIHAQDLSCSDKGLLPCESQDQCYAPKEKCNGFHDCIDESDENNCTHANHVPFASRSQNLAWLVTPILLLLGVAYGIYKCAKDGVCGAIRRRIVHGRHERESRARDYHPLHQVSFSTSTQIPCTQLGLQPSSLTPHQQQLMLIHNQSFSIQFQAPGDENHTPPQAATTANTGLLQLPSYEEAMSAVSDGKGGTIVYMKNGSVISVPPGGLLPPPYPGASTRRNGKRNTTAAVPAHMEAIEEVEEIEEVIEDDDDADEETFFLPQDVSVDGGRGRRRHHSQWSQKRRYSDRRRHRSCPS